MATRWAGGPVTMPQVQQAPVRSRSARPRSEVKRLASLDVFRGITIAAMILVNNPGDKLHTYPQLQHAQWNGWTLTDLIFPFFLFIVGVSMELSFESRRLRGANSSGLMLHVLKRSLIIFVLGLFLNAFPHFDVHSMRILGVLQRIALVYLATSIIVLYAGRTQRYVTCFAILLGYWGLMVFVPVPGYGPGVLTMDGSLAAYIDRQLMYNHLAIPHRFDPEGLLTTLPAIATCLIGVLAGEWIRTEKRVRLARRLLLAGGAGIALGYAWSLSFPINKRLWTSSYVLLTAGFAMIVLAVCYAAVDIRGWKKWAQPFVWYSVNALGIYFMATFLEQVTNQEYVHGVPVRELLYGQFRAHLFSNDYFCSMLYGLGCVLLFGIIAWALHRKRVIIHI